MSLLGVLDKARVRAQLSELRARLVRPVTRESVCYHYLPMLGVKSYLELSVNVLNPALTAEIYTR